MLGPVVTVTRVLVVLALVLALLVLVAPLVLRVGYAGLAPGGRWELELRVWRLGWPGRRLRRLLVRWFGRRGTWVWWRHLLRRGGPSLEPGRAVTAWQVLHALCCKSKSYRRAFSYLIRHTHVDQLRWETRVGAGDPCRTGIVAGSLWACKGTVAGYLLTRDRTRVHYLVRPDFDRPVLSVDLRVSLRIRVFHLLAAGFLALATAARERLSKRAGRAG